MRVRTGRPSGSAISEYASAIAFQSVIFIQAVWRAKIVDDRCSLQQLQLAKHEGSEN
jgi:hypothetical protein